MRVIDGRPARFVAAVALGIVVAAGAGYSRGYAEDNGTAPDASKERWSAERANAWYAEKGWRMGFNFVPSTACNTTEMWSGETFDVATITRELAMAHGIGFDSCRVFIQYQVWKNDPNGLKDRFGRFLAAAAEDGISVIPVLFDDCTFGDPPVTEPYLGQQREPVPGMILSSWTPSPGLSEVTGRETWRGLEEYVKDMVGTFANDARVALWDLYNEPGNSGLGNKSQPLMEAAFAWARSVAPSQPLTVGVWGAPPEISARQLALSDVVSFHFYGPNNGLNEQITRYKEYSRPVICTEWMARPKGSRWDVDLPLFIRENVSCYCWGMVNGRTHAQFAWESKRDAPEPAVWFHDLFHTDGTPYDQNEIDVIARIATERNLPPRGYAATSHEMAPARKLFDTPLRDTSICLGPEKTYYLTGTSEPFWGDNRGIRVWQSTDLNTWQPLGMVWQYGSSPWHKEYAKAKKSLWAPEIHYLKGTFWITYSMPGWDGTAKTSGSGLLRSTTGKPEGPYVDVQPESRMGDEIDASLFEDDDGSVYFVWHCGKIARMKPDMSGLAEPYHRLKTLGIDSAPNHHSSLCQLIFGANAFDHAGYEGASLFKANGRYYLVAAESVDGHYHGMVAESASLYGPYGQRYVAVPDGGHVVFFQDLQGAWWSTFFGNDAFAPQKERPGLVAVVFDADGHVRTKASTPSVSPQQ